MKILYMEKGDCICYELGHFLGYKDVDYELQEMERDIGGDSMWCSWYGKAFEKGNGDCGKICKFYAPRNGKSGICKHLGWCYLPTGKTISIKNGQVVSDTQKAN